jgi:hypothetical protein
VATGTVHRRRTDYRPRGRSAPRRRWPFTGSAPVPSTITLLAPADYTMRQVSGGAASFAASGTYAGSTTPAAVQYSLDGSTWTTLDAAPAGGTFAGTVSAPAGQYTLRVRFANSTGVTDSNAYISAGDIFVVAGQSNHIDAPAANQSYQTVNDLRACKYVEGEGWEQLLDPFGGPTHAGTYLPLLATLMMARLKYPVGFISAAEGGTGIAAWAGAGTSYYDRMVTRKVNAAGGGTGKVKGVLFWQWESDAVAGTATATYRSGLTAFVDGVWADFGVPTIDILPQHMTDAAVTDPVRAAFRAAKLAVIAAEPTKAKAGADLDDVLTDDGAHITDAAKLAVVAARQEAAADEALYRGARAPAHPVRFRIGSR